MEIGLAVIGAGHWGPNLIREFSRPGRSRVRWIVDLDENRRRLVGERFPDVPTSAKLDEVLADPDVDAVAIATPASSHAALIRMSLEAGKHVFVEKPICTGLDEGRDLVGLSRRRERVLMVGHVFLYNDAVRWIRDQIETNHLGKLSYITCVRSNIGPVRSDVNAAWDLASQDLSILEYWLGALPNVVSTTGIRCRGTAFEDVVLAVLKYANGLVVQLEASWVGARKIRNLTLVGERRVLSYDDTLVAAPIRVWDRIDAPQPAIQDTFARFQAQGQVGSSAIPPLGIGDPLESECGHFLECIATGSESITSGEKSLGVVRVLEAFDRSLAQGGAQVVV